MRMILNGPLVAHRCEGGPQHLFRWPLALVLCALFVAVPHVAEAACKKNPPNCDAILEPDNGFCATYWASRYTRVQVRSGGRIRTKCVARNIDKIRQSSIRRSRSRVHQSAIERRRPRLGLGQHST